ncbi:MAG: hypothetical protein KDD66_08890 [Bdellovibrionales bacterium]|nr:hypothetical protein [Bdellovibrionales bacterium]
MKLQQSILRFCALAYVVFGIGTLFVTAASADSNVESLQVNSTTGDGRNGRTFAKWSHVPQDRPIEQIRITLSRVSGGDDTFVNLRFDGGDTFENGKRVSVRGGKALTTGVWSLGGQRAGGKALVLNAYNGEVRIGRVDIQYQGDGAPSDHHSSSGHTVSNNPFRSSGSNSGSNSRDEDYCKYERIKSPRVEIGEMRASGGLFSGKYRVNGEVFGQCIEEAGYYENGRLQQKFDVPFDSGFKRVQFETKVRSGRDGEIRVLATDGSEDKILIDDEIVRRKLN